MRVPKNGALIFYIHIVFGLSPRFFVTSDRLRPSGTVRKINFVFFSLALHPFFRNFADVILDKR